MDSMNCPQCYGIGTVEKNLTCAICNKSFEKWELGG